MPKKEEVKAAVEAVKVEEAVKEPEKEVVKKEEKKAEKPAKAAAKKPAAKPAKPAPKTELIVQYQDKEIDVEKIEERVKAQFVAEGHRAGNIKTLSIYVKPEEYSAYYVINEKFSGRVDLF